MEGGEHEEVKNGVVAVDAPEASGLGGDDYVVVKDEDGVQGGAAPEDPVAVEAVNEVSEMAEVGDEGSEAAAPESKAQDPLKKAGSSGGNRVKKGKVHKEQGGQNGTAAAAGAHEPGSKKPSLSHSLSFPARGAVANNVKKSGAIAKQPKPDGKNALSNGSEASPGRVATKQTNSARVPATRRSLPVKSGSVDATANDTSSEVVQPLEDNMKPLKQTLPGKIEDDVHSTTSTATTPRAAAHRKSTASGFSFRLEERAEKRKEFFQKLEEKIHAKELEQTNLQAKSKESQEAEIKLLRKSLTFKATPMPTFYKEPGPPKVELKKIPPTRARSPKLGRHKPASSAPAAADVSTDGCISCGSPRSTNNSAKVNEGAVNSKPGVPARKPVQKSVTKLPSQAPTPARPETRPVVTKPKASNTKTKVLRAKIEQPPDNPVEIPPSESAGLEEPVSVEHMVEGDKTTGPDLSAPLVASNEVPVQG